MQVLPPKPLPTAKPAVTSNGPEPSRSPVTPDVTQHNPAFVQLGINASIHDVNQRVQEAQQGHRQMFGHDPSPGMVYDVVRGWSQGIVPNVPDLFRMPTTKREAQAQAIAGQHTGPLTPATPGAGPVDPNAAPKVKGPVGSGLKVAQRAGVDLSGLSATDPAAAAAIVKAQGHPLTPQQEVALKEAQGKEDILQGKKELMAAGVLPSWHKVGGAGGLFGWLMTGAYEAGTGLILGIPILGYQEVAGIKKSIEQLPHMKISKTDLGLAVATSGGSLLVKASQPLIETNKVMGKAVAKGTYNDIRGTAALATGDTSYLRDHPAAIWNLALLADGFTGVATRLSAAAGAEEGSRLSTLLRPPLPETKTLKIRGNWGEAEVQALNFENPINRWADNVRTNRMQKRYESGKGVVGTAALRAVNLQKAADFLDRNFSYASKFRRENEQLNQAHYQMAMYLARQLDRITAPTIDVVSALQSVPEAAGKNELSIGELKAYHVLSQGGDWREALDTMTKAHIDWRDAAHAAGADSQVLGHQSQITALKLAKTVLEKAEEGEARPVFMNTMEFMNAALDKAQEIKINKLGLDPETAYQREALEYDIYEKGTSIPDRKKLATLIKSTTTSVERLQERKGYVVPELIVKRDAAQSELGAAGEDAELQAKAQKKLDAAQRKIEKAQSESHPDLASAEQRLGTLQQLMDNVEERVSSAEHRKGQRRLPLKRRAQQVSGGSGSDFPRRSQNIYGEFRPADPSEMTHAFTGRSLLAGDIRLDFTNLIGKELANSVRASFRLDDYSQKLKSSIARPPDGPMGKFYAPMRKSEAIPDKWRKLVSGIREPGLSEADLADLTSEEVENWHEAVYGAKQLPDGTWDFKGKSPKDYVWYDRRAFSESREVTANGMQTFMNTTYNLIGRPRIFLAPRYLLYTLSNKAMLATHANFWTPAALAASHNSVRIYGKEVTDRVDIALGSSRSKSYGPNVSTEDRLNRGMTKVANFAHKITDQNDRRAAFYNYAWREGYRSAEDMKRLVTDDANVQDFSKIRRYSEKAMVELGNLSWPEQQYLQHLIFVYPWRSRQFLWSIRTLAEHPGQAAILSMIGQDGLHDELANKPLWIQSAIKKYLDYGYVITGWNPDGSPKGAAVGALNTFSGLDELMHPELSASTLGPGAQIGVETVTGKNARGADFTGNFGSKIWQAFVDVAIGTQPLALAKGRADKKDVTLPEVTFADRASALRRLNAAAKEVALTPGWLKGYGMLFTGSFTNRTIQKEKLLYNYYHSLTPEKRHEFELNLKENVLAIQGRMLKQPVPQGVRDAVDVNDELSYRINKITNEKGYTDGMPPLEHDHVLLEVLKDKGFISAQEEAKLAKEAKQKGALPADHSQFRSFVLNKYAGGTQLHLWDDHVRLLATYTKAGVQGKIERLNKYGLHPGPAPSASQETLYDVGRAVAKYENRVREYDKAISDEPDPVRKARLQTDLTNFTNESDVPLKVGGSTFPSLPRLSYSDTTDKVRTTHLVALSASSWNSMSGLDKELLTGKPVDPIVSEAWAAINERMAEERARLKPGESLPSGMRAYYINKVAAQSPAFKADLAFGAQTLATKMLTYKPIKKSEYASQWREILGTAKARAQQYIKAGYVNTNGKPNWTAIETAWVQNDLSAVQAYIAQQPAGFQAEVDLYTPTFLRRLVKP